VTNSHKKFIRLVVQIDYRFLSCKHFKPIRKHTISNSKDNGKISGKDDFKYIFSKFQHQDHKITTNDDTFFNSLSFPI
jgi:hypothetical protein